MENIAFYYPECKRDKERLYYSALYSAISTHKFGRTALLMLGSMFAGGALGGVIGNAVADTEGIPLGALAGFFGRGVAGGIGSDKIVDKSLNNIYNNYTKSGEVDDMLTKI